MKAEDLLVTARRELGTKEWPAGSNRVKYNRAYYGREVQGAAYPWCCVFLWWCFREAGMAELFYGGGKTASCGELARWAKGKGRFVERGYQSGDLVFLRFSGGVIEHIGVVERVNADGSLVTIEGNTGSGNEANGGQVQRRQRALKYAAGAYRPDYEGFGAVLGNEEEEMTQGEFHEKMNAWLQQRGEAAPGEFSAEARAWAEANGIVQGVSDGVYQYKSYCTREQMLVFLYRFLKTLNLE